MYCIYYGMPKGTSHAELTLKVKRYPVALIIVELHWPDAKTNTCVAGVANITKYFYEAKWRFSADKYKL